MIEGVVVRINDNKTVRVAVVEISRHQLYGKIIRKKKEFLCQSGDGVDLSKGDRVEIKSCRPYSKMKRRIVVRKISL